MKKTVITSILVGGISVIMLTSGKNGAGVESGYNATGSETGLGNTNGCKAGGCHGSTATTGITIAIELDSAGVATTHYVAGATYTVKITGTNTTSNSLPKYGFQVSCIKDTVAQVTPVNAGTFATTGLPAGVRHTAPVASNFVCDLIEHSTPLAPTTGTGGTGTVYSTSFQWTAPASGTGPISFWAALNAVNNNNNVSGDDWNTTKLVVLERPATSEVASLSSINYGTAFPNPVNNLLHLSLSNVHQGECTIRVFSIDGKIVTDRKMEITNAQQLDITTSLWAPGLYEVVIEQNDGRQIIPVVKQ